jgi:hypothetical protein
MLIKTVGISVDKIYFHDYLVKAAGMTPDRSVRTKVWKRFDSDLLLVSYLLPVHS